MLSNVILSCAALQNFEREAAVMLNGSTFNAADKIVEAPVLVRVGLATLPELKALDLLDEGEELAIAIFDVCGLNKALAPRFKHIAVKEHVDLLAKIDKWTVNLVGDATGTSGRSLQESAANVQLASIARSLGLELDYIVHDIHTAQGHRSNVRSMSSADEKALKKFVKDLKTPFVIAYGSLATKALRKLLKVKLEAHGLPELGSYDGKTIVVRSMAAAASLKYKGFALVPRRSIEVAIATSALVSHVLANRKNDLQDMPTIVAKSYSVLFDRVTTFLGGTGSFERGVFVYNEHVMLLSQYAKPDAISSRPHLNLHFVPKDVSNLHAQICAFIRPTRKALFCLANPHLGLSSAPAQELVDSAGRGSAPARRHRWRRRSLRPPRT